MLSCVLPYMPIRPYAMAHTTLCTTIWYIPSYCIGRTGTMPRHECTNVLVDDRSMDRVTTAVPYRYCMLLLSHVTNVDPLFSLMHAYYVDSLL